MTPAHLATVLMPGLAGRILTPREVADMLRVSPSLVRALTRRGELPAAYIGSPSAVRGRRCDGLPRPGAGDAAEASVNAVGGCAPRAYEVTQRPQLASFRPCHTVLTRPMALVRQTRGGCSPRGQSSILLTRRFGGIQIEFRALLESPLLGTERARAGTDRTRGGAEPAVLRRGERGVNRVNRGYDRPTLPPPPHPSPCRAGRRRITASVIAQQ